MTRIILALSFLSLFGVNHYVEGENTETTSSMVSTISSTVVVGSENTKMSTETIKKDASDNVDIFQDILLDPSLVVARLNRDVTNEGSTWSTPLIDVKDEHTSNNVEEDLNTEEYRYYSAPYWRRRQDWQVEDERPVYKKKPYRRFLKYPIFSGR